MRFPRNQAFSRRFGPKSPWSRLKSSKKKPEPVFTTEKSTAKFRGRFPARQRRFPPGRPRVSRGKGSLKFRRTAFSSRKRVPRSLLRPSVSRYLLPRFFESDFPGKTGSDVSRESFPWCKGAPRIFRTDFRRHQPPRKIKEKIRGPPKASDLSRKSLEGAKGEP